MEYVILFTFTYKNKLELFLYAINNDKETINFLKIK